MDCGGTHSFSWLKFKIRMDAVYVSKIRNIMVDEFEGDAINCININQRKTRSRFIYVHSRDNCIREVSTFKNEQDRKASEFVTRRFFGS